MSAVWKVHLVCDKCGDTYNNADANSARELRLRSGEYEWVSDETAKPKVLDFCGKCRLLVHPQDPKTGESWPGHKTKGE